MLLPYYYIWKTESTNDNWKLQQNNTTCLLYVLKFELTQNTKKNRLVVEQQGNPLFWFWWDTEKYKSAILTQIIYSISMGARNPGGLMGSSQIVNLTFKINAPGSTKIGQTKMQDVYTTCSRLMEFHKKCDWTK